MKAILISIKPEWVKEILNGKKTIEIRKTAPKCDLPIEVYIYCTKGGRMELEEVLDGQYSLCAYHPESYKPKDIRGKVVAKFTLREVTQYINGNNVTKDSGYMFGDAEREGVYEKACLSYEAAEKYCPDESFYAWHISDLVIFDKPKELSEFKTYKTYNLGDLHNCHLSLTKAPQSFMFIEVD